MGRDKALQEAIDKAGGAARVAAVIGISRPAVSQWKRCPAERVIELSRLSGVPRSRLRPDLYPPRCAAAN